MTEGPLLLPEAKSGVLMSPRNVFWWRVAAISLGVLAVAVGAADLSSRFTNSVLGCNSTFTAFAPAVSLLDPESISTTSAQDPCL
ncbi:MAG TPA: hypothetical protein VD928_03190 [Candidatus Paceibacterota bacterium]|nr:hypothetical protein [Candidatus Paceibacterota bacterium]